MIKYVEFEWEGKTKKQGDIGYEERKQMFVDRILVPASLLLFNETLQDFKKKVRVRLCISVEMK